MDDPYNEVIQQDLQAEREARIAEHAEYDGEQDEPTEEDLAIASLDREHTEDYLAIRRAVSGTDLSERLVELAVKIGLKNR